MLMEIKEFLVLQQIGAIHSDEFSLMNSSFEKHETLHLKTQEMFVIVESNNGAGAIIASLMITLTLALTIYGTVSMYCYDSICPVPCLD